MTAVETAPFVYGVVEHTVHVVAVLLPEEHAILHSCVCGIYVAHRRRRIARGIPPGFLARGALLLRALYKLTVFVDRFLRIHMGSEQFARRGQEEHRVRAEDGCVVHYHAHDIFAVEKVVYMLRNDYARIRIKSVETRFACLYVFKLRFRSRLIVHVEDSLFRPIFVFGDFLVSSHDVSVGLVTTVDLSVISSCNEEGVDAGIGHEFVGLIGQRIKRKSPYVDAVLEEVFVVFGVEFTVFVRGHTVGRIDGVCAHAECGLAGGLNGKREVPHFCVDIRILDGLAVSVGHAEKRTVKPRLLILRRGHADEKSLLPVRGNLKVLCHRRQRLGNHAVIDNGVVFFAEHLGFENVAVRIRKGGNRNIKSLAIRFCRKISLAEFRFVPGKLHDVGVSAVRGVGFGVEFLGIASEGEKQRLILVRSVDF